MGGNKAVAGGQMQRDIAADRSDYFSRSKLTYRGVEPIRFAGFF
jgi:hypothetical protein